MSIETAARKFLEAWYREFYAGTEEGEPTLDTPKLDALDLAYIELKRALETPPSACSKSDHVRDVLLDDLLVKEIAMQLRPYEPICEEKVRELLDDIRQGIAIYLDDHYAVRFGQVESSHRAGTSEPKP